MLKGEIYGDLGVGDRLVLPASATALLDTSDFVAGPLPPAVLLFASALFLLRGIGFAWRRKQKIAGPKTIQFSQFDTRMGEGKMPYLLLRLIRRLESFHRIGKPEIIELPNAALSGA